MTRVPNGKSPSSQEVACPIPAWAVLLAVNSLCINHSARPRAAALHSQELRASAELSRAQGKHYRAGSKQRAQLRAYQLLGVGVCTLPTVYRTWL